MRIFPTGTFLAGILLTGLLVSAGAASPCASPEICLPVKQEFVCEVGWEPASAQREINLSQPFYAQYVVKKVSEANPNWNRGMQPNANMMLRWRNIFANFTGTVVHTAALGETAILECAKSQPVLSVQRSAWVTSFQDQISPERKVTPEIRERVKKDRFDLSKGKVSDPILKAGDGRIATDGPYISTYFELIQKEFPTGVSFRNARNLFNPSFDEFLRFDSLVPFGFWANVERTQLILVNEKGETLIRFRRALSPFRYVDEQKRFTNSLEQELRSAQAYLRGLEGTHEAMPLPLMESEAFAPYRPLAALLESAVAEPSPQTVHALYTQMKNGSWPEVSKDLPLVEVGVWVKGFVDHVEAAYRLSRPAAPK